MSEESSSKSLMSKVKKFVIGAAIGFVVFIVAIFAIAFISTRGVADAANTFIADLQAGSCAVIYENSTAVFQENVAEEEWTASCEQISPILSGEPVQLGVEVETSTEGDNRGFASYEILGTDEIKYEVSLLLYDEDGWKLGDFSSVPIDAEVPEDTEV